MDILFRHYATDWIAMTLTLVSLYRLGEGKRDGFVFGLLANISWGIFGALVFSVANVLANVIFFALNIRGYRRWKRGAPTPPHTAAPS